jgi:DNA-binding transcriptional LysR family regulator
MCLLLRSLQADFSTVAINLRMTTMLSGERLVLDGTCALAVTITDVPELSPGTMERQHLCEARMVTVCAPSHPLAAIAGPIPREEFGRHMQLVVTESQPDAEKTQHGVAGERQWRVNDLGAKHDLLRGGLCWLVESCFTTRQGSKASDRFHVSADVLIGPPRLRKGLAA